MALSDSWDTDELDRAVAADKASTASRVLGVPSPEDMAVSALRRSGHGNALRGRDLRVLPGGVVVASPHQRPPRAPISPRSTPAGQPRPGTASGSGGHSAGDVLRIIASPAAAVGNGITNASTGSSGDSALGRVIGALVAGVVVLELGSWFGGYTWGVSWGGKQPPVVTKATTPPTQPTTGSVPSGTNNPSGLLTAAQLEQILGYNP